MLCYKVLHYAISHIHEIYGFSLNLSIETNVQSVPHSVCQTTNVMNHFKQKMLY